MRVSCGEGVVIHTDLSVRSAPGRGLADFIFTHIKNPLIRGPGTDAPLTELLVEFGPQLRMPHSKAFGEGLFELRPKGKAGIGRAFYCFLVGKRVVILHGFIKKSQQTPDRELKLAKKRMKEILNG